MRYTYSLLAALLLFTPLLVAPVQAESSAQQQVRQALADQDAWLSGQANAPGWNKYLHTPQLQQELSKGDQADPAVVQQILAQYQSNVPGMRLPAFVTTRKTLEEWSQELHQPKLADLPAVIRAAKEKYKPIAKADVLARQVAAEAAVRRLDRYLANSGRNGADWRKHLGLDELHAQLQKQLDADPAVLRKLSDHYVAGDVGLELRPFSDVGTSVHSYADLLAAYKNNDAKAQFEKQLDALAAAVEASSKTPNDVDRRQLGDTINQLTATGEAPQVVAALRHQLAQPNLLVRVHKDVVTGGINDDLVETTPIEDNILGTQISGSGDTRGRVVADLVPSRDKARIELVLRGRTLAHTVGWNGPVTIFAHSTTSLYAQKQMSIDGGVFSGEPACAQCSTNSDIDCLDIDGGFLIQRIATKRVYKSKGTAEAISAQHAEARLERRMDSRAGEMMEKTNATFNEQFRSPLLRRGAFPEQLSFSTTRDWLKVIGLQARSNELGASSAPPDPAADAALSIRLHESLLDNFTDVIMPGKSTRSLAYRRSMRDMLSDPYDREEFKDFVLCLAEQAAPADRRDNALLIPERSFESLMKDRFNLDVTAADFRSLTQAMYDGKITKVQYQKYLAGLSRDPLSYDDLLHLLQDARKGDVQVNYAATTFVDQNPVEAHFQDGKVRLVLRLQSTTQPKLDGDGHRIINPYPAEVYVTYALSLQNGQVTATRVEGEYGVKALPMPGGAEANLSLREKTRRSTLLTKTLPRRFFGLKAEGGAEPEPDEEVAEPIFPATKTSTGLTLRGRWKKLGELPWTQLTSQDGWLALGWKLSGTHTADATTPSQLQANNRISCRLVL